MNTHDLPPGIEVEIMKGAGVALESFTEYGRSVHFADGTQYWIRITNTTDTHAALNLLIDGRKANLSSILLYRNKSGTRKSRGRSVKGFELTRDSVELENDEFETTSTYEPFVAKRPVSGASATTDHRIGTIKLEFFATRYATRQPGRTQQLTASNTTPSTQHNARRGVMATGSGAVREKRGKHYKGEEKSGRRPVADLTRPLDPASFEITICERQQGFDFGADVSDHDTDVDTDDLTHDISELAF